MAPAHRTELKPLAGFPVGEGFGLQTLRQPPHSDYRHRIPKVFHQIYISGMQQYDRICGNRTTVLTCSARASCLMYLSGWKQMLWDGAAVESLLRKHYPWALKLYHSYDMEVKRADLARIFILHHFGGLYLDVDTQCFRDPTDTLMDFDFVIQGSGWECTNNGFMAAAPGLPLFQLLLQILEDRAAPTGDPIEQTGPGTFREMFRQSLGLNDWQLAQLGHNGGVFIWNNHVLKVYPLGTWYLPCWISDTDCRQPFEAGLEPELTQDLTQLVGYHQFASVWG